MAKRKPKQPFTFRCEPELLAALSELAFIGDVIAGENAKLLTKTDWLHLAMHQILANALRGQISEKQRKSCVGTNELFRLFVLWSRAERRVKGYGFSTKDKKTRFVYGPSKMKILKIESLRLNTKKSE